MLALTISFVGVLVLHCAFPGSVLGADAECAVRLERAVLAMRSATEAPGWLRVQCVTSAMKSSGGVRTDTLTITGNGIFKMSTTREQLIIEDSKNVVFILRPMKRIYVGRKGPEPPKKKSIVDEFLKYARDGHITKCTTADSSGVVDVDVELPPTKTKKNAVVTVRVQLTRDNRIVSVTYLYTPGSDFRYTSMTDIAIQSLEGKDVPTGVSALRYVYARTSKVKEEFKGFQITDISPRK